MTDTPEPGLRRPIVVLSIVLLALPYATAAALPSPDAGLERLAVGFEDGELPFDLPAGVREGGAVDGAALHALGC